MRNHVRLSTHSLTTVAARLTRAIATEPVEGADLITASIHKLKSLAVGEEKTPSSDSTFLDFQERVKDGLVSTKEILVGARNGYLTHRDLNSLLWSGAFSFTSFSSIQTQLFGGNSQFSLLEVRRLLQRGVVGKEELVGLLKKGDLGSDDLRFLVRKGNLPAEALQLVLDEVKDQSMVEKVGFSEVLRSLEQQMMPQARLETMLLSGDLHPDDLEILVEEGCLSRGMADRLLDNSSEEISAVYQEIEKLAEFVEKGRFSFEELEVMRAKGVLGDAIVHYLIAREVVDQIMGQQLLQIEEDHDYLDPEDSDEDQDENNVESDEGFYPKDVPKEDIFELWRQLFDKYDHRPGGEEILEGYQDYNLHQEKEKRSKKQPGISSQEEKIREPVLDAEGNARGTGRRKTAVAKVQLNKGKGEISINGLTLQEYFPQMDARCYVISPFLATDTLGVFDVDITVKGGGWSGKAQAVRHGISRALMNFDPKFFPSLKELGLHLRDSRVVERKKPGKAKARKSFQWVKR